MGCCNHSGLFGCGSIPGDRNLHHGHSHTHPAVPTVQTPRETCTNCGPMPRDAVKSPSSSKSQRTTSPFRSLSSFRVWQLWDPANSGSANTIAPDANSESIPWTPTICVGDGPTDPHERIVLSNCGLCLAVLCFRFGRRAVNTKQKIAPYFVVPRGTFVHPGIT